MIAKHAFADESARNGYLICVAVLAPSDLAASRQTLKKLCKPGQHRVHMKSESDSRRREILSVITELGVEAHVYQTKLGARSQRAARDDCLRSAIPDLISLGVGRLVIESCDQDHQDRQVVREMVNKAKVLDSFAYAHDRPKLEPLLWLPDIVAWSFGKGGDWRRRTEKIVGSVRSL